MKNLTIIAVMMAFLTLISKCIGFIREMLMANYFGASYITDAYAMSFTILSVLFGGIITALSTAYMPTYSQINENQSKQAGDAFTSAILNLLLVISIIISALGIMFSDQIIIVLASGFSGETAKLASYFVKVMFSYVIFSSTAGILDAYLQYKGVFLPQIVSGYFVSISVIATIIISAYTSYYYLAFGMLIGYCIRFALIAIIAARKEFVYKPVLKFDRDVKSSISLAIPTFLGSYALLINQFVDKTLASRLAEGSISALNYASLLNGMIAGLTITILSTIVYPRMVQAVSLQQYDRLNNILSSGLSIVIIITLPCALGIMAYSSQIVQIVFERGAFNLTATAMTGTAFFYYAGGLFFSSVSDLIIKVYYSMSNMKTPMIFAAVSVIINISLSLMLIGPMGHNGLALGTTIASFCNTCMLWTGIGKSYGNIKLVESKIKLIKIVASAVLAVGGSYLAYYFVIIPSSNIFVMRTVHLGLAVLVAVMIHLALLKCFKIEELNLLRGLIIRK